MINKQEKLTKVKLKGNESFNIREGWLRKGMRCVQEYPTLFSRDDAMEILGVGSKMVKSIRYWLRATGLTEESSPVGRAREQRLTEKFGDIVEHYDKYFDEIYYGPLFISKKILLSHEPINLPYVINIHGHVHNGKFHDEHQHSFNVAANIINYKPINLKHIINYPFGNIPTIHEYYNNHLDQHPKVRE